MGSLKTSLRVQGWVGWALACSAVPWSEVTPLLDLGLSESAVCSTRPPGRKCMRVFLTWSGQGWARAGTVPDHCCAVGCQAPRLERAHSGERRRMIPKVLEKKKNGLSS